MRALLTAPKGFLAGARPRQRLITTEKFPCFSWGKCSPSFMRVHACGRARTCPDVVMTGILLLVPCIRYPLWSEASAPNVRGATSKPERPSHQGSHVVSKGSERPSVQPRAQQKQCGGVRCGGGESRVEELPHRRCLLSISNVIATRNVVVARPRIAAVGRGLVWVPGKCPQVLAFYVSPLIN